MTIADKFLEISLLLTSLPTSNLSKIKETIKSDFGIMSLNFEKLYVTGGGSHKYANDINQLFGKFSVVDEIGSTAKGVFFFLNNIKSSPPIKFPVILANIGTGASFLFIDENKNLKRVGGTNIAGGTLLGLFSLSQRVNSSVDLSALIESGNSTNVDILVRDIYGKDYGTASLDESVVAGSLAKIDKYDGDNWTGDICASSAFMICSNIVHLLSLYAAVHGVKSVLFSGSFVTIPAISALLKNIASSMFADKIVAHILDFGAYLGCFGIASDLISE